jgi:small subunit ribosomal protein S20
VAPRTGGFGRAAALCYHPGARGSGRLHAMPNIRQQEKRVRSAARQRLENLRYRSTIKTLARRLETAIADGGAEEVERRHRELVRTIDRAAARGAIHRNAAARKKSQAARLVAEA